MKRLCLALAALMVAVLFCADSDAAILGRRRGGGGGNMGAGGGNGLCNMRVSSSVRPSQCVTGNCGLSAEPTPLVAPAVGKVSFGDSDNASDDETGNDADAMEYRTASHRRMKLFDLNHPSPASLVTFDAEPAAPISFDAPPIPIANRLARR